MKSKADRVAYLECIKEKRGFAAINLGFEYVGCELDADYYAAACKRIEQHAKQERLFA